MKKLNALLLTLVMSLPLAVPSFAAEPQEVAKENAICLRAGDSVTVHGITISMDEVDEAEALNTARAGKHYLVPTRTWTKTEVFGDNATCKKAYGNTLAFDLDNRSAGDLTLDVWVGNSSDSFYCVMNTDRTYRVTLNGLFDFTGEVKATWSVYPSDLYNVNFTIDAYQY